jgi:hypothetical protein
MCLRHQVLSLFLREHHRHFLDHVFSPPDDFAFAKLDQDVAGVDAALELYMRSVPMLPDPRIAARICSMGFPYAKRTETVPRPSKDACSRSAAPTSTAPQRAPGMMMSPALRLTPN